MKIKVTKEFIPIKIEIEVRSIQERENLINEFELSSIKELNDIALIMGSGVDHEVISNAADNYVKGMDEGTTKNLLYNGFIDGAIWLKENKGQTAFTAKILQTQNMKQQADSLPKK